MQQENRLKISNPQRVTRILRRICQASLEVMVRTSGATGIAVKGRASDVLLNTDVPSLRISNISDRGMMHLENQRKIQVEFIMMSTKVVFVSAIIAREQSSVLVKMPQSLVSIERRRNARYPTTEDLTAFLNLSLWKPSSQDVTSPPFYSHHKGIGGFIHVADLSLGGLCAVTRFPAVNLVLRRGIIDDRAQLVLPMQDPIEIGLEVRWFKRIKEHLRGEDDEESGFMRSYRFGIEFTSHSDDAKLRIRQFMQQVSQAEAI